MILPGLVSITFRQLTPREIIILAQRAGLCGIEWGGDIHVPHGDLTRAREVRQLTADHGLKVSAYGSYYRLAKSESEGLAFPMVLDTAVALGAPTIRIWAGVAGSAEVDLHKRVQLIEETRRIADLASTVQITISFEYHGDTLTDTNDSALQLMQEINHPNVLSFWQPPNGKEIDYCLDGLQGILPWLSCIHLFHWWPDGGTLLPLSEGKDRWHRYLELVRSTGRDHFACLEFVKGDHPETFLADVATLHQWLREDVETVL